MDKINGLGNSIIIQFYLCTHGVKISIKVLKLIGIFHPKIAENNEKVIVEKLLKPSDYNYLIK
jgi:hypothetical protein